MIVRIIFLLILLIFSYIGYKVTNIQNFAWDTAITDFFRKNYYGIPLFLIISLSMLFGALFIYVTMFYSEIKHIIFKLKNKHLLSKFEKSKQLISQAENAYESYRFAEAYEYLIKAQNLFDKDFNIAYYLGRVCLRLEKYEEAEKYLKKSIDLNPKYINAYIKLGSLYLIQKDYTSAHKYLTIALQLDKKNIKALFVLRDLYEATDDYVKALETNNRILQLSKAQSFIQECRDHQLMLKSILSKRAFASRNHKKSITYAMDLIKSESYQIEGYNILCNIYMIIEPQKLEKICNEAYDKTGDISFLHLLSNFYLKNEQPDAAISVFYNRIKQGQKDIALKAELARIYYCVENKEAFEKIVSELDKQALQKEPLKDLLLHYYIKTQKYDELHSLIERDPCVE